MPGLTPLLRRHPEHPVSTETKLKKIMELSKSAPDVKFKNLTHLVNKESLMSCFHELDGKKAVGTDGVRHTTNELYILSLLP